MLNCEIKLQANLDLTLHSHNVADLVGVINQCLDLVADGKRSEELLLDNPTFINYSDLVEPLKGGSDEEKSERTNLITDSFPTYAEFFEEYSSLFFDFYEKEAEKDVFVIEMTKHEKE